MAGEAWWAELEDIVQLNESAADPRADLWFTVANSKADVNALLHCRASCAIVARDRKLHPLAPLITHDPPIRGDELCKTKHCALWARACPLCASDELLRILKIIDTRTRVAK